MSEPTAKKTLLSYMMLGLSAEEIIRDKRQQGCDAAVEDAIESGTAYVLAHKGDMEEFFTDVRTGIQDAVSDAAKERALDDRGRR